MRGGNTLSQVKVKEGESLENALRRFKRQTSRDGVIQEVRKRDTMRSLQLRERRSQRLLVSVSLNN